MFIDLPDRLAIELKRIDWQKVKDQDLNLIIKIGVPLLERKGYLKTNKGNKLNEHTKKNSP
jgi:hypothetical protein